MGRPTLHDWFYSHQQMWVRPFDMILFSAIAFLVGVMFGRWLFKKG